MEGVLCNGRTWYPGYITLADWTEWKELIREALVRPAKQWRSLSGKFDQKKVARLTGPLRIVLTGAARWRPQRSSRKCARGTIATVQLDALRGHNS